MKKMTKWLLTFACLLTTASGFPLSVTNGSIMNPEMQLSYVKMFFMPVQPATQEESELSFHQNDPSFRKGISFISSSKIQQYDFWSLPVAPLDLEIMRLEESLANVTDSFGPNSDLIRLTMERIFNRPRNKQTHSLNRDLIGGHIYERLGRSGLIVSMQDFDHELPLKDYAQVYFNEVLSSITESGTNLIGILPGKYWNTEQDKLIIIGAHWDTVANTTGFDDNGSGVAVLLEVARVLGSSKQSNKEPCFTPDFTVIFVAFDSEEPGSYGSLEFIRKFLAPNFLTKGATIQAAIILDTVMNVDFLNDSQDVPENWHSLVPEAADSIQKDDFRGNFIALIGRQHPQEIYLNQVLRKWWEQTHQDKGFPYIKPLYFDLHKLPYNGDPTADELLDHSYFWLSDHSRFWYYREEGQNILNFPALLITDTAFHRGFMRECYHRFCDTYNDDKYTPLNYFLLEKIARTLIWTVSEIAMDNASPLNTCSEQSLFSLPKRTPIQNLPLDVSIVTTPEEKLPEVEKVNIVNEILENNLDQIKTDPVQCSEKHCHQKFPDDDESLEEQFDRRFGLSVMSLVEKLAYIKGPQINVGNLHLDFSTNNIFLQSGGDLQNPDIGVLELGKMKSGIISKAIENFFEDQERPDRRKYKGKHQENLLARQNN